MDAALHLIDRPTVPTWCAFDRSPLDLEHGPGRKMSRDLCSRDDVRRSFAPSARRPERLAASPSRNRVSKRQGPGCSARPSVRDQRSRGRPSGSGDAGHWGQTTIGRY